MTQKFPEQKISAEKLYEGIGYMDEKWLKLLDEPAAAKQKSRSERSGLLLSENHLHQDHIEKGSGNDAEQGIAFPNVDTGHQGAGGKLRNAEGHGGKGNVPEAVGTPEEGGKKRLVTIPLVIAIVIGIAFMIFYEILVKQAA